MKIIPPVFFSTFISSFQYLGEEGNEKKKITKERNIRSMPAMLKIPLPAKKGNMMKIPAFPSPFIMARISSIMPAMKRNGGSLFPISPLPPLIRENCFEEICLFERWPVYVGKIKFGIGKLP